MWRSPNCLKKVPWGRQYNVIGYGYLDAGFPFLSSLCSLFHLLALMLAFAIWVDMEPEHPWDDTYPNAISDLAKLMPFGLLSLESHALKQSDAFGNSSFAHLARDLKIVQARHCKQKRCLSGSRVHSYDFQRKYTPLELTNPKLTSMSKLEHFSFQPV